MNRIRQRLWRWPLLAVGVVLMLGASVIFLVLGLLWLVSEMIAEWVIGRYRETPRWDKDS